MAGFWKSGRHFFLLLSAFIFAVWIFVPAVSRAQTGGAALFLNPASGKFLVGSTFDVSIILDTKGKPANTIEIDLSFPQDLLQVANPSLGQSIIQVWPAPPTFSNREGRIRFVGGIPNPGIVTSDGVVLTLTFRVTAPGSGQIKFGDQSKILANDGFGTNILGQTRPAFYGFLIQPSLGPEIFSPSHPDQERWYNDPNPVFVWESRFGDSFSYSLDENPSGSPDAVADGTDTTASFSDLNSGVWYFHLREHAGNSWSGVSHYSLKLDTDSPAAFKISVSPSLRTTDRNPVFRFFTTDALAGFDHYSMKIISLKTENASQAFFFETDSPYQVSNFAPGRYRVIVRAHDRAGNVLDESVTLDIVTAFGRYFDVEGINFIFIFVPWPTILAVIGAIIIALAAVILTLWIKHKHHLYHAFKEDVRKLLSFKRSHKNDQVNHQNHESF